MKEELVQAILIILLILLGTAVTQAEAVVITVNNSAEGNYTLIQEAVNNAQNGDTILVSPGGIYRENIKVNKEPTILSHFAFSGSQIIRAYLTGAVPINGVFSASSDNVTITEKDADGNDIINTPYVINQTAGAIDYMPLVNRFSLGNISEAFSAINNAFLTLFNKKYPVDSQDTREKGVVVETTEFEQINISLEEGPVFLKLGAEWCGACQSMEPILEELAAEYGEKTTVMSMDINKNPQLATYFEVDYIPDSFVIVNIENGKYIYMQQDGNVTTDRAIARIVGLGDKKVFEKVLKHALAYEEKGRSG
jgi:thiol-disulfide isomerase/thioredoxin